MGMIINFNKYKLNDKTEVNTMDNKNIVDLTQEQIEQKASELLAIYNLDETPVNLYDICNRLGIKKVDIEFKKYDGDYILGGIKRYNEDDIKIFVNDKDGYERQRFTIAHEIGHYYLGHLDNTDTNQFMYLERRDGYNTNNPIERQANQFAAALLMNKKTIEEKFNTLREIGLSTHSIEEVLADMFGVSRQSVKYRLKNLRLVRYSKKLIIR